MRTVCIYTAQDRRSVVSASGCAESAGVEVELYEAVMYANMDEVHDRYGLTKKYTPVSGCVTDYDRKTVPQTRMANGTTHYLLYRWSVENDEPIHILEHDAIVVDVPPEPIYDGVIQTSSHIDRPLTAKKLWDSGRAKKQRKHESDMSYDWDWVKCEGVIPHPLSGTNGTSGYVIGPGAAKRMIDYIESDGIANADRLRKEHLGEDNVYLQVPQSVICTHCVRSHVLGSW